MSSNYTKEDSILEEGFSLQSEEYSRVLHRISDLDELVQIALDSILAVTEAHAGSLFLWDEHAKEFVAKAGRGSNEHSRIRDIRIRLREGIAGRVAERGFPVLVTDIRHDDRFADVPRSGRYNTSSFICLPLTVDNKLIGVINITEKESRMPFSERDQRFAESFSKHIAVAYENLRMKQRLQNENHALTARVNDLSEALNRQENFVMAGKLASNLAHELTNPLDAIRRFVNLALDESLEDSLTREYLLKAKKGVRRAVNVIRGLLQFSKDAGGTSLRISEIHTVIESSIESLSHDQRFERVGFEKQFHGNPLFIRDGGMQIVFKNLLENSVQAMYGNGQEPKEPSGRIAFSTKRENGSVIIQIKDTGSGIPENFRTRIFEPFFTTKGEGGGTGIGLAICREIVERSGGKISVEDHPEPGALFQIVLPCVER